MSAKASSNGGTKAQWRRRLKLRAGAAYFLPSGFRVRMEKQSFGSAWRLVGTRPRGTFCHKPCTVSGGGKSEISKSIAQALLTGPVFVRDYRSDMEQVAEVFAKDYSAIYKNRPPDDRTRRTILGSERTLGSVIQLLTPSPEYTEEHNEWVRALAADHPPTGVHHQALLRAGMGRPLARALHRRPHQRLPGP